MANDIAEVFRDHMAALFPQGVPPDWLPPGSVEAKAVPSPADGALMAVHSAGLRRQILWDKLKDKVPSEERSALWDLLGRLQGGPARGTLMLELFGEALADMFARHSKEFGDIKFKHGQRFGAHLSESWFVNVTLPNLLPSGTLSQRKINALRAKAEQVIEDEVRNLDCSLRYHLLNAPERWHDRDRCPHCAKR